MTADQVAQLCERGLLLHIFLGQHRKRGKLPINIGEPVRCVFDVDLILGEQVTAIPQFYVLNGRERARQSTPDLFCVAHPIQLAAVNHGQRDCPDE